MVRTCKTQSTILNILHNSSSLGKEGFFDRPLCRTAVEFLVNFVTNNAANAYAVFCSDGHQVLFHRLLICSNPKVAAASAALIYNCVAQVPDELDRIVKPLGVTYAMINYDTVQKPNEDDRELDDNPVTLLTSIMTMIKQEQTEEKQNGDVDKPHELDDRFTWAFLIIRRLITHGMTRKCFEALRSPLNANTSSENNSDADPETSKFTSLQRAFLHLVDAGTGRSAEQGDTSNKSHVLGLKVLDDEDELQFFGDALDTAFFCRDAAMIRCTVSIIASLLIVNKPSKTLKELRLQTVKIAIAVLQATSSPQMQSTVNDNEKDVVGLKANMVRAIAISCDNCEDAQNLVLNLKGVPVVLNALAYEENVERNPFLREWAVLAVRNLTLGNQQVVDEINSLEFIGLRNEEWLDKAGLEAFVDDKTGRPRVRQKEHR